MLDDSLRLTRSRLVTIEADRVVRRHIKRRCTDRNKPFSAARETARDGESNQRSNDESRRTCHVEFPLIYVGVHAR